MKEIQRGEGRLFTLSVYASLSPFFQPFWKPAFHAKKDASFMYMIVSRHNARYKTSRAPQSVECEKCLDVMS